MNKHPERPLTNSGVGGRDLGHITAETEESVHLVSVGTIECGCLIHDSLLNVLNARLSMVTDCRRLWEMPEHGEIHLVILHDTLSSPELDQTSRLIRRRWPQAKILVIRAGEDFLEDALYDERETPSVSPRALLTRIKSILNIASGTTQGGSS